MFNNIFKPATCQYFHNRNVYEISASRVLTIFWTLKPLYFELSCFLIKQVLLSFVTGSVRDCYLEPGRNKHGRRPTSSRFCEEKTKLVRSQINWTRQQGLKRCNGPVYSRLPSETKRTTLFCQHSEPEMFSSCRYLLTITFILSKGQFLSKTSNLLL